MQETCGHMEPVAAAKIDCLPQNICAVKIQKIFLSRFRPQENMSDVTIVG